jgi:[1-hydroxy-2-(trimethylamino)ethyl]phosphonate dioxygenase
VGTWEDFALKRTVIEEVHDIFEAKGAELYLGEAVTQLEHALQCATFAKRDGGTASEIVAALLHDIGHLLHHLPEDCADHGIDDRHEQLGGRWLEKRLPPSVTEPVRLHVAAKRYLCRVDANYAAILSPSSVQSLRLQGGPMNDAEVNEFNSMPHAHAAVRLRRWDDEGKIVGLSTPTLAEFTALIPELQ